MKNNFLLWIIGFVIISLITTCKKDSDECPVCPRIANISPVKGRYNDLVTITGSNFAWQGNIVKFNGVKAEVISETNNEIVVRVPLRCGSGDVSVDIDADLTSANTKYFQY